MNHRNIGRRAALVLTTLLLFASGSAFAQATRTWVSGVGDDANPCSRTAPCKTFAGAISKTAAGGYINVIDPGGFGAVTITKSITIDGGPFHAGVLASGGSSGIIVNGAGVVVRLRNLQIEGGTPVSPGGYGVRFIQGAALILDNVEITDFRAAGTGYGVFFAPTTAAVLSINNCLITNNGGPGIMVQPTVTGSAKAAVTNTRLFGNLHGVVVEDRGVLAFADGAVSSNVNSGFKLDSASAAAKLAVNGTQIANNGFSNSSAAGIKVTGASATAVIGGNTITGNYNGLLTSLGVLASFGNNQVHSNTVDGSPTVTVATR
ncbi:MAG TPA: right-handed parallel beta-helix repeat-containing protein [Lysobacter sp.]